MATKSPRILYKYYSCKYGLKALLECRVRWAAPTTFNDPYDCDLGYSPDFTPETYTARVAEGYLKQAKSPIVLANWDDRRLRTHALIRERIRGRPESEHVAIIVDLLSGRLYEHLERSIAAQKTLWKRHLPKFRVFSMSQNWDIPTMWAHYAEDFHGVVLGFKPNFAAHLPRTELYPVKYDKKMKGYGSLNLWVNRLLGNSSREDLKPIITYKSSTKSNHWRYEREWRYVRDLGSGASIDPPYSLQGFQTLDLMEIMLGPRMMPWYRNRIRATVLKSFPHIKLFQVEPDSTQFKLIRSRIAL